MGTGSVSNKTLIFAKLAPKGGFRRARAKYRCLHLAVSVASNNRLEGTDNDTKDLRVGKWYEKLVYCDVSVLSAVICAPKGLAHGHL